jgi:hypothetical protein
MANITNTNLQSTETSLAVGGATPKNLLKVSFFNIDASTTYTVTVYSYASGGSGSDSTTVDEFALPPRTSFTLPKDQLVRLGNGNVFSAKAGTSNKVVATINFEDR